MEPRRRMVKGLGAAVTIAGMCVLMTARTGAGSATANLNVSATVANNCTITVTSALAFGSYDPVATHASAPLDGTGTLSVACTKGAVTTIGFDDGQNVTAGQRRIKAGSSDYLNFELYKDSARTSRWGNSGSEDVDYTASSKAATSFTIYGRVAAGQDVPAGSYADTVVATVNF